MPLVDGIVCTQMIRKYEKEIEALRNIRPRIPIIAVSASLSENKRFDYIQSGYVKDYLKCTSSTDLNSRFDAWILKPIDFGRLDFLLQGIKSLELKMQALYVPGYWERGGWFMP